MKIFNQPNQLSGTCCTTTDTEVKIFHEMKPFQSGAGARRAKPPKMYINICAMMLDRKL